MARTELRPEDRLLTPNEVALMFRVDPKTVTRWAKAGRLSAVRTLGGHRRYSETEVRALLADDPGLGKTAQVLLAATEPVLVVAPAMLAGTWQD